PALVVSPWIAEGRADDTLYDHASIVATLRSLFGPNQPPLTRRDRMANRFDHLVQDLNHPRQMADLPDLTPFLHPSPAIPPVEAALAAGAREFRPETSAEQRAGGQDLLAGQLSSLARKVDRRLDELGAPVVAAGPHERAVPSREPSPGDAEPDSATVARFRAFVEQQRSGRGSPKT